MKRVVFVLALLAALVPGDTLLAQTEISARGASIRIGGRLQGQFQKSSVDDTDSDFFFRRARLIADVTVTDFWSARLQTDFVGGAAKIQDAYVRMNFSDNFQVDLGQFKRAFDLFELSSSTDLSIIERDGRIDGVEPCFGKVCSYGNFIDALELGGRDQGIRAAVSGDKVSFMGTLTNGTGANAADENASKSFSGRLTVAATEDIDVSGQFALHDYFDAGTGDDEYANAWSLDAEYGGFRDGLHVQAAIAGGDNWTAFDANGDPVSFFAWQAVVSSHMPLPGERITAWEPLFRISSGDPDTDVDDNAGLVYTPGVMFYISGRNKFGINVDVYSPQTGDTEYGFKFQTFVYF